MRVQDFQGRNCNVYNIMCTYRDNLKHPINYTSNRLQVYNIANLHSANHV